MTERESYIKLDIRGRENLINKDSEREREKKERY